MDIYFIAYRSYLLGWSHSEEDIGHPHCLDEGHYKADVIPNAQEYSCYLSNKIQSVIICVHVQETFVDVEYLLCRRWQPELCSVMGMGGRHFLSAAE